jgi:hypothetical protein
MKKLKTIKQSQRDSRWSSVLLGYNTNPVYNIGNYGCLITSFANYLGKTPVEINDILKANQGFVNGGEFVWSKSTVLGLNEVYCSPRYDDAVSTQGLAKMKQLIDEGRPLIAEIDFNPTTIQEEMHFVLIHGYDETKEETFFAVDPWTGTEIDLSVYGGVRRTLYRFRAYDKTLPFENNYYLGIDLSNIDSIKVCIEMWYRVVVKQEFIEKKEVENNYVLKSEYQNLQNQLSQKDETIKNLNQQIKDLNAKNTLINDENRRLQDQLKDCQDKLNEINGTFSSQQGQLLTLTQELNQLKLDYENDKKNWGLKEIEYQKQIKTLQTKYDASKSSIKKLIINYIFGKKEI